MAQYWPVFFHKGAIAGLNDLYYAGHFVFDLDVDQFFIDGEVVRDGRKCFSMKTLPEFGGNPVQSMQYEYIIDPELDHSVVALTYYKNDKPFYSLSIDVIATKQPRHWAPGGWKYTSFDGRGGAELTIKVKVTDFAEDERIGADNPFDIVPPEGAKVGRSHHVVTRDRNGEWDFKIIPFKYEVKDGKLVQVEGPELTPEWWVTDNWRKVARRTLLPAATLVVPRLGTPWKVRHEK